MSAVAFVKKAEKQSRETIDRSYREIDNLYWEVDFLNNLLLSFLNKKSGYSLSYSERQREMDDICEIIPEVYKNINYFKECINVEKKEMKRIHAAYGYGYEPEYYKEIKLVSYEEYKAKKDSEDDSSNDSSNDEPVPYTKEDEELEEIKDYKYNHATGLFE